MIHFRLVTDQYSEGQIWAAYNIIKQNIINYSPRQECKGEGDLAMFKIKKKRCGGGICASRVKLN